ncbi:hypothetical protein UFOVP276_78 [uncultured Caudovirales phage]|uniref:Uncharacterized protein n=1 Tax=uncultured Caudovirales phage TaxID=2100421 RepID=A0A6J5LQ26_9CAUD|nr:hypothetical protein UFOVP127_215 [uncultured Caudovirales phage]CAB4135117.1 hypothetical protein UFOVP276_78 [uncultured Caudovirales phage]
MTDHEASLLAVLQKVGQQIPTISGDESAVLDAATIVSTTDRYKVNLPELPSPPPLTVPDLNTRKVTPITNKNLFVHHDTHPVVFDIALLKKYKAEWFEWQPETLWKEIKEDFRVPSISDHAKSKIQAIRTLHIGEMFWKNWESFCWITQSLNNNIPDWHVLQKPSLSQLMNSVNIAEMVRTGEVFALEVSSFIAASILDEGVFYAPHPISFCQSEIDRYLDDRGIERVETTAAVQKRYREAIKTPSLPLEENLVDIQVAKLKVAWDYQAMRGRQLKEQLQLLT